MRRAHRMLSDATLGALVSAIGYTPAQIVTRLLTVAGYVLVLPPLFSVFALSALDAAVVVMSMALIGQDIVGGEWLFSGYEAKVAAYILVLMGAAPRSGGEANRRDTAVRRGDIFPFPGRRVLVRGRDGAAVD